MSTSPDLDRFHALVAHLRPRLHRYCARMTGSVFDGEDVVQDTLAKAFYALATLDEPPPLEPWLFRIAHNTAMDFLRRYERKHVDLVAEVPDPTGPEERGVDPTLVEAALTVFAELPPAQRSAIVLKDVLGLTIEETAGAMGTTVPAVKSALQRARARVPRDADTPRPPEIDARLRLYARLFDARDWDALRALVTEESRLDLVSRTQRRGVRVAEYWSRYAEIAPRERLRAVAGSVDGAPAIAMFRDGGDRPAYFVRVEWDGDRIAQIRDYYHVPSIADGARFTLSDG
ncbi:sigma-70 family RNA polymerase sigma factor [Sandaracinus amylolyticus]|uniref:sigma-70 family RNA polymerase sigma factor n=1 Tax=Sandaracinus amylolyticus TaxID=927083 RepID=UPI001F257092|nr:sigma-70 family RNA polymerase sigma factor [Sandaracinus amylolyticus]UJR83326.1 Hypothetical protein I5071_53940 [Sandaracinus amylolyticus]